MRCFPAIGLPTDQPYWVSKDSFLHYFDQDDFHCRIVQQPDPCYLANWFFIAAGNRHSFVLPTVHFVAGKTQFINGRHRTAVLFDHLDEIPLAFAFQAGSDSSIFERMEVRALDANVEIELPDLTIVDSFPE